MNALILFDIDGTLVRGTGPHHRDALSHGIRQVLKLETNTEGIPVHGMLDQDILTQMLERAGLKPRAIQESLPAIQTEAEEYYLKTCPDLRKKTCPAARELLYKLKRRRIPLALVTGNLTRIGWKKLEQAGIAHYFAFGSFSETAKTRAGLAKNAIRRARAEGLIDRTSRVILVGDAPSDILAAKANGIRSVAVATGISTADDLRTHQPDELLTTLRKFRLENAG